MVGLVGVSIQISFVFGLTAFLTHSTSSILTKLASIPCLLNCLLNNLLVPP